MSLNNAFKEEIGASLSGSMLNRIGRRRISSSVCNGSTPGGARGRAPDSATACQRMASERGPRRVRVRGNRRNAAAGPRQVTPQSTANLAEMGQESRRRLPDPAVGRGRAAACGHSGRRVNRSRHKPTMAQVDVDHRQVMRQRMARFPTTCAWWRPTGRAGRPAIPSNGR